MAAETFLGGVRLKGVACIILTSLLSLMTSVLLALSCTTATNGAGLPKLLLVSFDGFGWNFLSKVPRSHVTNFEAFMKKGVHVRWVENVFPTMTRPNHMSLVTGLYPESHGIVDNDFYDPAFDAVMPGAGSLQEKDSKWVDMGAEPIWLTNSMAGAGRQSGTIYWPCADARIKGRLPDQIMKGEWSVEEETVSAVQRIDKAFGWLTQASPQPVNFVAVYMNEPDEISHRHGLFSQQLLDSIASRDRVVEHIMDKMKKLKVEDSLNVIITADHGHSAVYLKQMINLDTLVPREWYTIHQGMSTGRTFVMLFPNGDHFDHLVAGLRASPFLHVADSVHSEDLLDLHFSLNRRIAPVVLYAEPGWFIGQNGTTFKDGMGQHGWDPRYAPDMYPFFMALGPAFKENVRNAQPFSILDVYPLMCHLLGIKPAPNNGSLSKTAHILSAQIETEASPSKTSYNYTGVGIGLLVVILAVVVIVVVVRYVRSNSRNVSAAYKRSFTKAGSVEDLVGDGAVILSDEEL